MKQAIYLITISLFLFLQFTASAQQSDKGKDRWEKYRSEKVSFLTDNLQLSPEEAQKFWPIYNQLDKERWDAQRMRREIEREVSTTEESLSDKKIIELTRKFAGSMQIEADLLVSYNEKFLKILPPKKVLKLYKAENEFRMHMIKKYRNQHKNGDKHP